MAEIFGRLTRAAGSAVSSILSRQREEEPEQPRDRRSAYQRGERPRQMRPLADRQRDPQPSVREQAQAEAARQQAAATNARDVEAEQRRFLGRDPVIDPFQGASGGSTPAPPSADSERIRRNTGSGGARPDYWRPRVPASMRTEIAPTHPVGPGGVVPTDAVALAARVTAAPEGYLRALAGQEGLDDEDARNPRSSATGLMQFTEATWIAMLGQHGRRYGLPDRLANAIQPARGGGFRIVDRAARDEIMRLRNSGEWSAIMGGHLFHEEAEVMQRVRGRPVQVNEVYLGHFMGGDIAGRWMRMIDQGRGNVDARTAIRELYRSRGGPGLAQAQRIIDQNPRQFAPGVTVRRLYDMQTGDFVAHGVERGESREALTAIVRAPRRNDSKQSTLVPSRTLAAEQQRQQNADRFGTDEERRATRDPFSGAEYTETAEERRLREQQEREIAERASRQRRTSVAIEGDRVRVRVPFN